MNLLSSCYPIVYHFVSDRRYDKSVVLSPPHDHLRSHEIQYDVPYVHFSKNQLHIYAYTHVTGAAFIES